MGVKSPSYDQIIPVLTVESIRFTGKHSLGYRICVACIGGSLEGADLRRAGDTMLLDCPNKSQMKMPVLDITFARDIASDIGPGMTPGSSLAKRPLLLRCSAGRITVQRFVHLQNMIGAHGL
jgi:hypothetical protein